jgi:hypothetical protein
MNSRLRSVVVAIGGALRDFWMILGITLVFAVVLETCYRGQGALRKMLSTASAPAPVPHPYADSAWYPDLKDDMARSDALAWRSYVYFRHRPFRGHYVTVDDSAHRLTVQPSFDGPGVAPVFFFGGSTMYGSFQRDSMTIPSCVARRLGALGNPSLRFRITNFGETGYIFAQEVVELELELRNGARPRAVVFYDGINDVMAALQNGAPGIPQNERNRAIDFDMGRVVFNWRTDFLSDLQAWGRLFAVGLRRSQLLQRLRTVLAGPPPAGPAAPELARQLVESYVGTAQQVEALAKAYGFQTLYVWQPALHGTGKALTPFEQRLVSGIEGVPFQQERRAIHGAVPAMLDSAMAPIAGARFVNLSGLFTGYAGPVFVDDIGHTTEAAIPLIVNGFWKPLGGLLGFKDPGGTAPSCGPR